MTSGENSDAQGPRGNTLLWEVTIRSMGLLTVVCDKAAIPAKIDIIYYY